MLKKQLISDGSRLFRWRSFIPILLVPLGLFAFTHAEIIKRLFGHSADRFYEIFCVLISFTGIIVRAYTIGSIPSGTSGRNTKRQVASTLNTTGIYSLVRHPLYLGNFLITLGIALFPQVWWFTLIVCLTFALFYERIIMCEEHFLHEKFGDTFVEWSRKTPTFFPNFRLWKKPQYPFSMRMVLRREYSGILGVCTIFPLMDSLIELIKNRHLEIDSGWLAIFIIGFVFWSVMRILKKSTSLLDVDR